MKLRSLCGAALLLLSLDAMAARDLTDNDADGIADSWETMYGADLNPDGDLDNDGLTNLQEYQRFEKYDDLEAKVDALTEAQTRLSPIATHFITEPAVVKDSGFRGDGTTQYTVTWTVLGYDDNYTSTMAIFDCTDEPEGYCGERYSDAARFLEFVDVAPASIEESDWSYTPTDPAQATVYAKKFTYTVTFAMPATREDGSAWKSEAEDGGTQVVFRWYQKSDKACADASGISLLIGAEAGNHYDDISRRIQSTVSTDAPVN